MCYAIPGKVIGFEGNRVVVDYFGEKRKAINEMKNIRVGDYVYAQGGFVVERISEEQARPILEDWKEMFFELKKIDSRLSRVREGEVGEDFRDIIEKARSGRELEKQEILRLLESKRGGELKLLFESANKIRQESLDNACCVHGIIEFSNYCRNNCSYCGIRKGNEGLERYRMSVDEIVEVADNAVNKLGFRALVLQSGEDEWYDDEKLVEIIERIKERCGVLIFMSIGNRTFETYKKMYQAGARGVLIRFETSNPELYRKFHSGEKGNLEGRLELIRYCDELGYLIAIGGLVGFPGQTDRDLMEDILLTKELGAEMYSFGPLIPHPGTPLGGQGLPEIGRVLKVLAVSRLVDHNAKILVTTALETLDEERGRRDGLLSGANSLMINVTPKKYREQYSIYPGRPDRDKEITKNIDETIRLLHSIGRAPTDLGV
jgi:biotin synthase